MWKRHLPETCWRLCSSFSPPQMDMATETLTVPARTARVEPADLEVRNLGRCAHTSPLLKRLGRAALHHVGEADRVLLDDRFSRLVSTAPAHQPAFELAGPRDRIFF